MNVSGDAPSAGNMYSARQVMRIAAGSGGTGLVVGLIGSSFSAAGTVSMTIAAVMLAAAWIVGIVAIVISEPVWGLRPRHRVVASLAITFGLTVLLGGIGWFQYEHLPVADRGTARVSLKQVAPEKLGSETLSRFAASIQNDGNAIALNTLVIVAAKLTPTLLSAEQLEQAQKKVFGIERDWEQRGPSHVQIAPGMGQIVHLSDIDDVAADHAPTTIIRVSDSQIQDFNAGKLALYVFFVSRYEDETVQGRAYWDSEACGYFIATFVYLHNCGPTKIEKTDKRRFP